DIPAANGGVVVRAETPAELNVLARGRCRKANRGRNITARITRPGTSARDRIIHTVAAENAVIAVLDERSARGNNVLESAISDLYLKQSAVPTGFRLKIVPERDGCRLRVDAYRRRCQVRSAADRKRFLCECGIRSGSGAGRARYKVKTAR